MLYRIFLFFIKPFWYTLCFIVFFLTQYISKGLDKKENKKNCLWHRRPCRAREKALEKWDCKHKGIRWKGETGILYIQRDMNIQYGIIWLVNKGAQPWTRSTMSRRGDNQGIAKILFLSRTVVTGKAMSRQVTVFSGQILLGYYKARFTPVCFNGSVFYPQCHKKSVFKPIYSSSHSGQKRDGGGVVCVSSCWLFIMKIWN